MLYYYYKGGKFPLKENADFVTIHIGTRFLLTSYSSGLLTILDTDTGKIVKRISIVGYMSAITYDIKKPSHFMFTRVVIGTSKGYVYYLEGFGGAWNYSHVEKVHAKKVSHIEAVPGTDMFVTAGLDRMVKVLISRFDSFRIIYNYNFPTGREKGFRYIRKLVVRVDPFESNVSIYVTSSKPRRSFAFRLYEKELHTKMICDFAKKHDLSRNTVLELLDKDLIENHLCG